ncbi:chorismate mutase [Polycladidibacter hongkongensis]|uniref:chorismate mutase n=1 Tax=Polycladidibacter hongkongensis TaxID=1647556 RepID=UPI00082C901F|nr:chorismate mutase [Pseudovibrio hongkongensis]
MKRPAQDCQNMAQIREQIDRMDKELIALFAERFSYITRAAEIKPALKLPARIDSRVEEVVRNVEDAASEAGLNGAFYGKLWRQLIDQAIEHEEDLMPSQDKA